jgi:hypothetical protein
MNDAQLHGSIHDCVPHVLRCAHFLVTDARCRGCLIYSMKQKLFQHLFSLRTKYTKEEIEPYIGGLHGHYGQPKDAASLLLLHSKLIDGSYYRK